MIARRNAGASVVILVLRISTLSLAGCLNSAASVFITCPDSPDPDAFGSIVFVPIALPIANDAITNASHPKVAVFQCEALHRPIRAAKCLDFPRGVIGLRLPFDRLTSPASPLPPATPMGRAGV